MDTNGELLVNFFSGDFKKQAHDVYAKLRKDYPVYPITMPNGKTAWLVTRYDDVAKVLKDPRLIRNSAKFHSENNRDIVPSLERRVLLTNMLGSDPPDHTRLRSIVQKAFTPRIVAELRDRIEKVTNLQIDRVQEQGWMDVIEDFAIPISIHVICETLGISSKDQKLFREWSLTFNEASNDPKKMEQLHSNTLAYVAYMKEQFEFRRQHPQEDLLTKLVQTKDGDGLTEDELYSMVFLLLSAGHETTVNMMGNGMLALLENPDQLALLQENPNAIDTALEELLRYYSPAEVTTNRYATEDIHLYEATVRKGEIMLPVLASANRDERKFTNPDQLDILRKPNHHFAFGYGIHYCIGAPVARLEGKIVFPTLFRRVKQLNLKGDMEALEWNNTFIMRGLRSLPIEFQ
jgi:cytochrome P450